MIFDLKIKKKLNQILHINISETCKLISKILLCWKYSLSGKDLPKWCLLETNRQSPFGSLPIVVDSQFCLTWYYRPCRRHLKFLFTLDRKRFLMDV
jgi:hypothetical protein